jgi:L-alanine-DL-glutamate epimerase-like enolase superfamily enzyme
MKIKSVGGYWAHIPMPPEKQHRSDFGRTTSFDAILVRIDTRCGLTRWGEAKALASPAGFIVEYSLSANPLLHDLVEEACPVQDAEIQVPDRPGLGITVREAFLADHTVR